MARILLFNPENDVRLGEVPGRTPRKLTSNVVALGRDGALLPMWWATENDYILVRGVSARERNAIEARVSELKRRFGLSGNIVFEGETTGREVWGAPWGWSYDSASVLSSVGAVCPTDSEIEILRQLSHRRTASEISARLATRLLFPIPAPAVECCSIDEVENFIGQHGGAYVKMPWSSSGRGVIPLSGLPDERMRHAISAAIRRQGCVMCEVPLTAVQDFAMLFYAEGGSVTYRGLSIFETNGGTSYSGNLVDSEDGLKSVLIGKGADSSELDAIKEALELVLTEIIGLKYTGWLGIDMLVLADGGIAPCIELNLRMTMGVVALLLARCLPTNELPGRYGVAFGEPATDAISLVGNNQDATFSFQYRKNI